MANQRTKFEVSIALAARYLRFLKISFFAGQTVSRFFDLQDGGCILSWILKNIMG